MSYQPVSGIVPQYSTDDNELASGYYLKFYIANTTTPLSMATDSTGGTLLVKAKLNPDGLPISNPLDNDTVFIPHVNQDYRLVIYRNEADADANNTAGAFVNIPSVSPLNSIQSAAITWHPQTIDANVTIPAGVNAWSFGPTITISDGFTVTVTSGSFWTIANGEVIT